MILQREVNHISAYIQIIGRGLRSYPGKTDCIVLDLGENLYRHGCFVDVPVEWTLEADESAAEARKEALEKEPKQITCTECAYVYTRRAACPNCGHAPAQKDSEAFVPDEREAEIVEITDTKSLRATKEDKARWWQELDGLRLERGYSRGWASWKYKERFGVWPTKVKHLTSLEPSEEVRRWVKSRDIAWAKRKGPTVRDATAA